MNWSSWLYLASAWVFPFILGLLTLHLSTFMFLWVWSRWEMRRLCGLLEQITRPLHPRSVLDRTASLSEQIEAFLADLREILGLPHDHPLRETLRLRLEILDEQRRYLRSHRFETWFNVTRTMIEAYPLLGTMGAILAIGSALHLAPDDQRNTVSTIVRFFGEAIWSTAAGLLSAIILMFINSALEPGFDHLLDFRAQLRELLARAKRELALISVETRVEP
ncbi:MAG: hypothetical protein KatS3mg114_1149 [Planctomycetaceae bacterium]|nr:MAG: hypothetical protein KatS3mg114_1149 [Planctomycetaceae bacterium]